MDLDLIIKLIGSLALVVGLLLATLFLLKRQGLVSSDSVQVESSVSVGPKERILLIRCGEQQILVGATTANIRTLHVLGTEASAGADSSEQAQVEVSVSDTEQPEAQEMRP